MHSHLRTTDLWISTLDENGDYEEIEQRFVNPVCKGGHHNAAELKRGVDGVSDCNFVLAARIGDGARGELEERGIAAFEMPGPVPEAIRKLDGYLKLLQEMNNNIKGQ